MAAQTNQELINIDIDYNEFDSSYDAELGGDDIIVWFCDYLEPEDVLLIDSDLMYTITFWIHKVRRNNPFGWADVYWDFPQIDDRIKHHKYFIPSPFGHILRTARRVIPQVVTKL